MPTRPKRHKPIGGTAEERRGTRTERGYDNTWLRFREWYIKAHPLCQDCEAKGFVEPATEVHHVRKVRDAPHLKLVEANVMGLCKSCHSKRSARGE